MRPLHQDLFRMRMTRRLAGIWQLFLKHGSAEGVRRFSAGACFGRSSELGGWLGSSHPYDFKGRCLEPFASLGMRRKAIFIDRDGVINKARRDYVKSVDELEILPGAARALRLLRRAGYMLIVITNQSAVGRGIITRKRLSAIHEHLRRVLSPNGIAIDAIYYCPHRSDEGCTCRKPRPGLILKASAEHNIDLRNSWLIGDDETDIAAGKAVGCRTIMIHRNERLGLLKAAGQVTKSRIPGGPRGLESRRSTGLNAMGRVLMVKS